MEIERAQLEAGRREEQRALGDLESVRCWKEGALAGKSRLGRLMEGSVEEMSHRGRVGWRRCRMEGFGWRRVGVELRD